MTDSPSGLRLHRALTRLEHMHMPDARPLVLALAERQHEQPLVIRRCNEMLGSAGSALSDQLTPYRQHLTFLPRLSHCSLAGRLPLLDPALGD